MVNNYTNINKLKNTLSDGQQLHQYQQIEKQCTSCLKLISTKKTMTYANRNPSRGFG